ncbi:MAG: hypothetical protein IJ088_03130 [Clostridia bacterium]|nr:hypothetical protein [Clostridia bacterium]
MKNAKKSLAVLALAVLLLFTLSACSFSSSSSVKITTSVTDENGETKTNTISTEVGAEAGPDGVKVTTNQDSTN